MKKYMPPRYRLHKNSDDVFFARRETQCIAYMLYGKTVRATAEELKISPRTAEDYVNSAKLKLQCRSKSDFLWQINHSDFRETAAEVIALLY